MVDKDIPAPVRAAKWSFWILAAVSAGLGSYNLVKLMTGDEPKTNMWVVMGLMFANALVMVWLGWGIGRQSRRFLFLAVAYLVFTIILTITDQFGIWDLLMLISNMGLLGLLLATRGRYS